MNLESGQLGFLEAGSTRHCLAFLEEMQLFGIFPPIFKMDIVFEKSLGEDGLGRILFVAAHLRSLRSDDPLSKGHPRPIKQRLKL